jgi:hypothetical protein
MFVIWTDNRTCGRNDVFVNRVSGSGAVATGWPDAGMPVCSQVGGQGGALAVADDSSGVIIVWEDGRLGEPRLYAQRIGPDGARLWNPEGVALCDAAGSQVGYGVLADGAGGVFVAWSDSRRGLDDGPPHHHTLFDLYAQRIDRSGARVWPSTGEPVVTVAPAQGAPHLVTDGGSGVLLTWLDGRGSAYMQHLDATGGPHLVQDGVAIPGRFLGFVAPDGDGGMISAFMYGPDTQQDLYAQRVDATGVLQWPLNGVLVATAPFDQRPNAILPDGNGGAFIAWHDLRNGQDWDVYVQRVTAAGIAAPGWPANGLAVATTSGNQIYPQLVPDLAGGCVLAWYDARDTTTGYDTYAQRITGGGVIAPGWPAGGDVLCHATGDQVTPLPVTDGSGGALVAWSDYRIYADVYAQRVSGSGVVGDASPVIGVEPPHGLPLALGRLFPDPLIAGPLFVALSLPDASPAELSLFDLKGRRLVNQSVRISSIGPTVVRLETPHGIASGVYMVRLSQAGRMISKKISILR